LHIVQIHGPDNLNIHPPVSGSPFDSIIGCYGIIFAITFAGQFITGKSMVLLKISYYLDRPIS
jgi:hypothetical protein